MASFNRVVLVGNVTRNPDVRSIPGSSTAVARTGFAVNRKFKEKEDVMFIDIVAFGKTAEFLGEYVTKGAPLLVEGRLSMSSWEQDGVKRTKHEVIIDTFQMLGGRKDRTDGYNEEQDFGNSQIEKNDDIITDDDVPF